MNITRNRLGSVLAVTALLGVLTACGGGTTKAQTAPTPTATTSTSSDPSGSPSHGQISPTLSPLPTLSIDPSNGQIDYCKNQKPFTGKAADTFGADKVADAYCTFVTLEMTQGNVGSYLRQKGNTLNPQAFIQPWSEYMTKTLADEWAKDVKTAFKTDKAADDEQVWSLMSYDALSGSDYQFGTDPTLLNQSFTPAKTAVDVVNGEPRLGIQFTVSADMDVLKKGTTSPYYLWPVTRHVNFALIRNPNKSADKQHEWLIDAWTGTLSVGKVRLRGPLPSAPASTSGTAPTN